MSAFPKYANGAYFALNLEDEHQVPAIVPSDELVLMGHIGPVTYSVSTICFNPCADALDSEAL